MTVPQFPVYLFDVDGTLTDSAEDICGTIQELFHRHGHAPQDLPFLKSYIGRHLRDLFEDVIPGVEPRKMEQLVADYRTMYAERAHGSTRLYPGVAEALSRLGGRKSTATTKGTPTTRIVLEKFGLLQYFDHVQGTDGFPAKPAPDVIWKSLEALQADPRDVLLVGDAPADIAAGKAAGVKTCAVRYGYGDQNAMRELGPDFWINSLAELL